jgi:hypothetical protein
MPKQSASSIRISRTPGGHVSLFAFQSGTSLNSSSLVRTVMGCVLWHVCYVLSELIQRVDEDWANDRDRDGFGPKDDGTYVVEFRTSTGEAHAISVPRGETTCSSTPSSGCPTGCSVPDAILDRNLVTRAVVVRLIVVLHLADPLEPNSWA